MKGLYLALVFILSYTFTYSQFDFSQAYQENTSIPSGLLEAVSFTQTRFQNITENTQESCLGIPLPYGVMGLFENGAGYFRENGLFVADLSGISIADQKSSTQLQILAYAKAFQVTFQQFLSADPSLSESKAIYFTLSELTEIPDSGIVNQFARDAQAFEILRFMNDPEQAQRYNFSVHNYLLKEVFGTVNVNVLSGKKVRFTPEGIKNEVNQKYTMDHVKSTEYGPAIWNPAPSCNFSSRNGTAVSAITIHTIQGTYSGAISWSQNCSSSVSYHYVIRSSDGQITQMVAEADKAWHVGSENPYTIGYEHEGYVDNTAWYTEAMYTNSADLSRDIINSGYGITGVRTYYGASSSSTQVLGGCTKIKGHQHYPSQTHTDPGINWNWEKYYRLINNNPTINTLTSASGSLYDSGGSTGNYVDDERLLWLIQPTNASSITVNFSAFNVESGYDRMFIYDGSSLNATLIGSYTGTTSPGTISSTGGSLLIEFRSDCGTVSSGWAASYTSTSSDDQVPVTSIISDADWKTSDFTTTFADIDNIGVIGRYYLVSDKDPSTQKWSSNEVFGFCNEDFSVDANNWTNVTGAYALSSNAYTFGNTSEQNSNTFALVDQNNTGAYLYEWDQNITSTLTNQRAGLHFFCDDPNLPNRGNSYFVYFRETDQKAQIYKVTNDVFSQKTNDVCVVTANTIYTYKVTYDPQSGWIKAYADGVLVTQWQDIEPLQVGNAISLRSGGCSVDFDNIRVYRSRNSTSQITVGTNNEMRFQSMNADPSGKILALSVDEIGNWSGMAEENYLIDWTEPELAYLNDGVSSDIDTTFVPTLLANWLGSDEHSGIGQYEVAIGILPSLNNILNWTNVSLDQTYSHLLSAPVFDIVYHYSLRITNVAGLTGLFVSNGQRLVDETSLSTSDLELNSISIYPNPATEFVHFKGITEQMEISVYDMNGKLVQNANGADNLEFDIHNWSKGSYKVIIQSGQDFIVKKLVIQN